jgi:hypothetical protein
MIPKWFWVVLILQGGVLRVDAQTANSHDAGQHFLLVRQGKVDLMRSGWGSYTSAGFGTSVRNGDLLRLDPDSRATVICADLTLHELPHVRYSGVPCSTTRPILVYKGVHISSVRGEDPEGFPTVLSPRRTRLLTSHPFLRWAPVADATSYRVTVHGTNPVWSSDVHGATEMKYPENAPRLLPGVTYNLTVAVSGNPAENDLIPESGFTLLHENEAQVVIQAQAKIRSFGLPEIEAKLMIARLYAFYDLNAEAIDQLEIISKQVNEPVILQSLGELYASIGLNQIAKTYFLKALDLSKKVHYAEGEAVANSALGKIFYEAFGNKSAAGQFLRQALSFYKDHGDTSTVRQLREELVHMGNSSN